MKTTFPGLVAAVFGILGGVSAASAQCHGGGYIGRVGGYGHGYGPAPVVRDCGPYGCNRPGYGPVGFASSFRGEEFEFTPNPGSDFQRNSNVPPTQFNAVPPQQQVPQQPGTQSQQFQQQFQQFQQQQIPQQQVAPQQQFPQQVVPQPQNFTQNNTPSSPFFNVPEQRVAPNGFNNNSRFTPPSNGGFNPPSNGGQVNGGGTRVPVQQFVADRGNGGFNGGGFNGGGSNPVVQNGGVRAFNAPPVNNGGVNGSPVNGGGVRAPAQFAPSPANNRGGRR